MAIRNEEAPDFADIRRVNDLAFGQPAEGAVVDALRAASAITLSLVAEDEGTIAGHILFSPVVIESDLGSFGAIGLGPMAVLPAMQRRGIGSALVREGLARLRNIGHAVVVVLGHPEFYPRFGFAPASRFGIRWEHPAPDAAFMLVELVPGALAGRSGVVRYRPEFAAV